MGTALLKSGAFALDCLLRGTAHRKVRSGSGVYFDDLARGLIEDKEARPLASRLEAQWRRLRRLRAELERCRSLSSTPTRQGLSS